MICLISGNLDEARRFAAGQFLDSSEWFYPETWKDLMKRKNFHVLVIGSAGQNVPQSYFDQLYSLAKQRGSLK